MVGDILLGLARDPVGSRVSGVMARSEKRLSSTLLCALKSKHFGPECQTIALSLAGSRL